MADKDYGNILDEENEVFGLYGTSEIVKNTLRYLVDQITEIPNVDELSNIQNEIATITSQLGASDENKFTYSYNANGDIQTVTEKSKTDVIISTTTYTYKTNGDVDTSVKVYDGKTITTQYIYDANGNLTDTVSTNS